MLGNGAVHTSSPGLPTIGLPCSSKISTCIPSERAWSSPRYTGPSGLPPAKHEMISVPPLMLLKRTSCFTYEYT